MPWSHINNMNIRVPRAVLFGMKMEKIAREMSYYRKRWFGWQKQMIPKGENFIKAVSIFITAFFEKKYQASMKKRKQMVFNEQIKVMQKTAYAFIWVCKAIVFVGNNACYAKKFGLVCKYFLNAGLCKQTFDQKITTS